MLNVRCSEGEIINFSLKIKKKKKKKKKEKKNLPCWETMRTPLILHERQGQNPLCPLIPSMPSTATMSPCSSITYAWASNSFCVDASNVLTPSASFASSSSTGARKDPRSFGL